MKDHIVDSKLYFKNNTTLKNAAKRSSVSQHLLENKHCGINYDASAFTVLHQGNNANHLKVLEAIFIILLEPELCKQQEFDYTTSLI